MAAREGSHFRKGERAYILTNDFLPVYISEGSGDLDYDDAVELSIIRRAALGLPATREFISAIAPPPEKSVRQWNDYGGKSKKTSHTARASKNNPYVCVHCAYKTTRCGNMVMHLRSSHSDHSTDPRDNHG